MTTESNSANSNSDFDLLNQKDGWLTSQTNNSQCCCIVCQGTAVTSIYHPDNGLPVENDSSTANATATSTPPVDLSNTFKLHSNPNSKYTVYLDFDGHTTENTYWNNASRVNSPNFQKIESPQYNTDGNASSLSDTEKAEIQRIWQRVAEDFAPFDVNVTTELPDTEDLINTGNGDDRWGVRAVITDNLNLLDDELNGERPSLRVNDQGDPTGGVAQINSFSQEVNPNSPDTPAFVFNGGENPAANLISHEVGHTLGLTHDGPGSGGYYPGHGTGDTSWGTIMGGGLRQSVTHWSKGEYKDANNTGQDDLAVITTGNGFTYRDDDYGNTNATASALTTTNTTNVSAFGIIERNTDIDVFSFVTGQGNVNFEINPSSWTYISDGNGGYTREYLDSRGANLDILATLYNADGTLIREYNPTYSLSVSFNESLDAGEYYIHIDGTGTGDPFAATPTGYTDYGSLGQYQISGTIVTPPTDLVGISATDASKNEGDSGNTTFTFTVTRSGDITGVTTVDWEVIAATTNSADANDFVGGFQSDRITFAAGETSREITIEINGDADTELDENFVVKLSNLSQGTLAPDAAIGTIKSDDAEFSGSIWDDIDNDGVRDAGEFGVAGRTVYIDDNQNGVLDSGEKSTITDSSGNYTFTNINPGTYKVNQVLPSPWIPTFPQELQGKETYKLDDGDNSGEGRGFTNGDTMIFNAFETQTGLENINYITLNLYDNNPKAVFIYQDKDGDDTPDGNEKLVEVATNFTANSGFATVSIPTTTVNGTFFVGALYEGNGTSTIFVPVDNDQPGGNSWRSTTDNPGEFDTNNFTASSAGDRSFLLRAHSGGIPQQVTVTGGQQLTGVNFGTYRPPSGSISGFKWNDSNKNGIKDGTEQGLANWTIFLDANDNGKFDSGEVTTTTGSDGNYTFSDVNAGTYHVGEVLQPDWQPTFPNQLQGEESYKHDDGDSNGTTFNSGGGDFAVFNSFEAQNGSETINFISILRSQYGNPKAVYIYQDSNNNNQLEASEKLFEDSSLNITGDSGFATIPIDPTTVSGTFFVGALYEGDGTNPTTVLRDTDNLAGKSWHLLTGSPGTFNTNSSISLTQKIDRNYFIRAHSGPITQKVTVNTGEDVTDINFGNYSTSNVVPTVSITATDNTATEAGDTANFRITRTGDTSSALTVNYTVSGSATNGTDYSNLAGSVTIAAGETDADITITPTDDSLVEANENVILTLTSDAAYNLDTNNTATANITDNDTAGITITESGGSTNVTESGETDNYEVVLNSQPTSDVTITINSDSNTSSNPTTLTFTNANWNIVQSVTVNAIDDNQVEGNHTGNITHTVSSTDTNYNGVTVEDVTVNITDNDTTQISIVATNNAAEPSTNGLFTVSLSKASTTDTVVSYTVSGTGSSGNDYVALSNSVTIKAGETTATIDVSVIDDNLIETDETVIVTLSSITSGNSNISIGNSNQATLTINSDDVAATAPVLVNNTLTISEGATFTFTSSNLSATDTDSDDANLIFTVSNVTGGNFEVDGVANNSFTQQQITDGKVKFIDDGNENAPSYDITVSDGSLTDSGSATVNFTNVNDAPTDITLSNSSVAENDIAAVIGNL
ncbi:Calx-beta domain-containing protein, partial [Rivularia sp. UHCC 0363]|uniref:Calx-beta domain-containing protein n=1 Tax=Rivularia sp. UHCC 0363 TaxID=3110244 RepID=UPI002B215614